MKNKRVIIIVTLTICILGGVGTVTGAMYRDKDIILSKDVSGDIQAEESQINNFINDGKSFLNQKKYDEAKANFEKAIAKEITRIETYTSIIDIYKDNNRYDDAYYFLKLIKTNGIEFNKYVEIETDIKSKFKTSEIGVTIYSCDKYEYPKQVKISVNNEDKDVEVKWENENMDLTKPGNYVIKGLALNYDRDIILYLEIKKGLSIEEAKKILVDLANEKETTSSVEVEFKRVLTFKGEEYYNFEKYYMQENKRIIMAARQPLVNKNNGEIIYLAEDGSLNRDSKFIGFDDLALKKHNELINDPSFRNLPLKDAIKKVESLQFEKDVLLYGDYPEAQKVSFMNWEKEKYEQCIATDIRENDSSTIGDIAVSSDEDFLYMKLNSEFDSSINTSMVIVGKKDKTAVRVYLYDNELNSYKCIGEGIFKMNLSFKEIYG